MAPNTLKDPLLTDHQETENKITHKPYPYTGDEIKWMNVILISALHIVTVVLGPYGLINSKILTIMWGFLWAAFAGFGVTGGVHRFWTHRSYKAKLPLRIILALCFSVAGQNEIYDWVRDHRVHHKYSETHADPHNANRGFFFAHVGWLMKRKRPEVIEKGNQLDLSDVLSDPVVQFHHKYFALLKTLLCFVIPTVVPCLVWGENWWISFIDNCLVRYVATLNATWLVNSAAHIWGNKPYDRRIQPAENIFVSIVSMGEGWHNYHHVFPWDYKAAELGSYGFNFTTGLLDMFAKIGWAYDLKHPRAELVKSIVQKHGDGSHLQWGSEEVLEEENSK